MELLKCNTSSCLQFLFLMRCISCLLSETSNCIELIQGKTLTPQISDILQKLKNTLSIMIECSNGKAEDSFLLADEPVSAEKHNQKSLCRGFRSSNPTEAYETSQTDVFRRNQNQEEEHLSQILGFSVERFKLIVDQLAGKQDGKETDCTFDEDQFNLSVEIKTNQALKLLKVIKKIISKLNQTSSLSNTSSDLKQKDFLNEGNTHYKTSEMRSSARSLLTEQLKRFHQQKVDDRDVVPCYQGKFIIKKNWILNNCTEKENISEPLNSISNVSNADSDSFGAYSLDFPRLNSKSRPMQEEEEEREIFKDIVMKDGRKRQIPMFRDQGCSKCQIY